MEENKQPKPKKQPKQQKKYEFIVSFEPYIFDFINNFLLFQIPYIRRLDKVLDSKMSEMSYEHRQQTFSSLMASEGKASLCLYFTYSYLAHAYKNDRQMDEIDQETKIPLIEDMFDDTKD